jgi:hypothetical protein
VAIRAVVLHLIYLCCHPVWDTLTIFWANRNVKGAALKTSLIHDRLEQSWQHRASEDNKLEQ